MILTMFKEPIEGVTDPKLWPWSMRRGLAFGCFIAFLVFGILSIQRSGTGEWFLFIPCGLAFIGFVLLCFFTTLNDLKEFAVKIAEALKGKA
jgi:hypothetical protein